MSPQCAASTGPPLIGGGERNCTLVTPSPSPASTGPPLIGGGEALAAQDEQAAALLLQRVRR